MRAVAILVTFVLVMAATANVSPSSAIDTVTGNARVVYANLIQVAGVNLRLFAIEALAPDQTCDNGLVVYPCGQVATSRLAHALINQTVVCELRAPDGAETLRIAVCHVGDIDIGDWMVRSGFALAERANHSVYAAAEAEARSRGTGIWRGPFVLPWDWRAGLREPATPDRKP